MIEIYFYIVLVFFSYYALILLSNKTILFRAFIPIFVIFSLLLRLSVKIEANADYFGYYFLQKSTFELKISSILGEPYFPVLNLIIKYITGKDDVLSIIYYINLIFSTFFFVWVAGKKDLKLWIKVILFSFEYFLFTYTTIRNSVAYMLFGVLVYELLHNRKYYLGYFAFLSHVSVVPALLATLLEFKKPTLKKIILVILAAAVFSLILNLPIFNFINAKFDAYSNVDPDSEVGKSIVHKIYFVFILLLTGFLYFVSRRTVYNTFYIGIFAMYVGLFFVSPVMAFRFSLYIIIYLCLYPFYKTSKFDKALNFLSILLILIFIKAFIDTHSDINLL